MPPGATNPKSSSTQWTLLALAVIILVTSAIRWPMLSIPFERDEGEYAYIGWRLGCGEVPYRDWVNQKPPGVFWAYRAALALPMDPVRAVHFIALLFAAGSACALFFVARRFQSPGWAVASAVLFAILLADTRVLGQSANTELFMLLPLILAQVAFFSTTDAGRYRVLFMILSGMLTGLAAAFKQVAAVNWLFLIAVYPAFVPAWRRGRGLLCFAGWSTLGAAAVWGLITLYFQLKHGLPDYIHQVFTHNFRYVSAMGWEGRQDALVELVKYLARTEWAVWILFVAGIVFLCRARRWRQLFFVSGWALSSAVGVSASGYYFPHYFQQQLPVLVLAAMLGAEAAFAWPWWHDRLPASVRGAVLGLLLIVPPALNLYPFLFRYTPYQAIRQIYPRTLFADMPKLARRLDNVTKPDDKVFIFGAEPELYFYARRVCATRYIFLYPLYGQFPNVLELQKSVADEIVHNHPAAVLSFPIGMFFLEGTEQYFTHWCEKFYDDYYGVTLCVAVDSADNVHFITDNRELSTNTMTLVGSMLLRTKP